MKLINKGPHQYNAHPVGAEFEVSEEEGRRILRDFLGFHALPLRPGGLCAGDGAPG